jgi:hypothetical protein
MKLREALLLALLTRNPLGLAVLDREVAKTVDQRIAANNTALADALARQKG